MIYLLDGKEIQSNLVSGFVHVANSPSSFGCVDCHMQVMPGEKYVRINMPFYQEPFHLDCYLFVGHGSEEGVILGVGTSRYKTVFMHKAERAVVCKRFQDSPELPNRYKICDLAPLLRGAFDTQWAWNYAMEKIRGMNE